MKIELRRVSHNARLSEETYAFAADVWIDGKKAGEVSNEGHGGCHRWHPHDLEARIDVFAKTLPKIDCSDMYSAADAAKLSDDDRYMDESAETFVSGLVTDWLVAKDMKRSLAKRILYTKVGQKGIYQSKPMTAEVKARMLSQSAKMAEVWMTDKVLNLLPEAEALAVYRANA